MICDIISEISFCTKPSKDILGYVSGITSIKLSEFILTSMIARIPGIIATTYVGASLYKKDYDIAIIISAIMIIIFGIGILRCKKVLEYLNKLLYPSRGR